MEGRAQLQLVKGLLVQAKELEHDLGGLKEPLRAVRRGLAL